MSTTRAWMPCREGVGSVEAGTYLGAGGDDRQVGALAQARGLPDLEVGGHLAVDLGIAPAPEPDVHRARPVERRRKDRAQLVRVRRADDRQVGDRPRDRDVLERVVAGSVEPEAHARVMGQQPDRHARVGAVRPELLAGEQREIRRERPGERDEAGRRHAGRDRHHVLLGDADVEEPIRMARGEIDGAVGVGEVGGEHDDPRIRVGEVRERLAGDERGDALRRDPLDGALVLQRPSAEDVADLLDVGHQRPLAASGCRPLVISAITSS